MFASIAARYDLANDLLSGGIHRLWRRHAFFVIDRTMQDSLPVERALDVATGTGALLPALLQRAREVVGIDPCVPMVQVAQARQLPVTLLEGSAECLPFPPDHFSLVTVAYGVRNFSDLSRGLAEIVRVARPDGVIAILEFGEIKNPCVRWLRDQHARWIMPWLGGLITGNAEAYRYLPHTSATFPSGQEFAQLLRQAGAREASAISLWGGLCNLYIARK